MLRSIPPWDVVEWANERSSNRYMRPEKVDKSQFKVQTFPHLNKPELQAHKKPELRGQGSLPDGGLSEGGRRRARQQRRVRAEITWGESNENRDVITERFAASWVSGSGAWCSREGSMSLSSVVS